MADSTKHDEVDLSLVGLAPDCLLAVACRAVRRIAQQLSNVRSMSRVVAVWVDDAIEAAEFSVEANTLSPRLPATRRWAFAEQWIATAIAGAGSLERAATALQGRDLESRKAIDHAIDATELLTSSASPMIDAVVADAASLRQQIAGGDSERQACEDLMLRPLWHGKRPPEWPSPPRHRDPAVLLTISVPASIRGDQRSWQALLAELNNEVEQVARSQGLRRIRFEPDNSLALGLREDEQLGATSSTRSLLEGVLVPDDPSVDRKLVATVAKKVQQRSAALLDRLKPLPKQADPTANRKQQDDVEPAIELEVWIDPGDASAEEIAELYSALTDLNRAAGGHGLQFRRDGLGLLLLDGAVL